MSGGRVRLAASAVAVGAIALVHGCTPAPELDPPPAELDPMDAAPSAAVATIEGGAVPVIDASVDGPVDGPVDAWTPPPPPWKADGAKNGDETDVDCGGKNGAPPCALGRGCSKHTDCTSTACRYDGVCITSLSCTQHFGGDTCGPTGTGDCCTAIPVPHPSAPYVLDKFSITSGRFRQFVERTNGNLRGWLQAHRPADWDPVWDAWLPTQMDDGVPARSLRAQLRAGVSRSRREIAA